MEGGNVLHHVYTMLNGRGNCPGGNCPGIMFGQYHYVQRKCPDPVSNTGQSIGNTNANTYLQKYCNNQHHYVE